MEISMEGPQKNKNQTTMYMILLYFSCAYIQRNIKSAYNRATCTHMFITALFTIAKLWNQPRCPTIDKQIKKM
jgi:hypothetical protein